MAVPAGLLGNLARGAVATLVPSLGRAGAKMSGEVWKNPQIWKELGGSLLESAGQGIAMNAVIAGMSPGTAEDKWDMFTSYGLAGSFGGLGARTLYGATANAASGGMASRLAAAQRLHPKLVPAPKDFGQKAARWAGPAGGMLAPATLADFAGDTALGNAVAGVSFADNMPQLSEKDKEALRQQGLHLEEARRDSMFHDAQLDQARGEGAMEGFTAAQVAQAKQPTQTQGVFTTAPAALSLGPMGPLAMASSPGLPNYEAMVQSILAS